MTFNEYQETSRQTLLHKEKSFDLLTYSALGLAGESGEVVDKIKKVMRDGNNKLSKATKQELAKELGDVFWYLARLCDVIGHSMDEVAEMNIEKLFSRQRRGKIGGSGDNR